MKKAPKSTEMSKGQIENTKRHQKFDYTLIADRLRTDSRTYPICVLNRFTGLTVPLPATAMQSKGYTFKNDL